MDSLESRTIAVSKICPLCSKEFALDADRCREDGTLLAVVKRDPLIGRLVAERYKILEAVGIGGFSTVYKGSQINLHRFVAIKVLHPHLVASPEKIRRFQQEAEAISKIVHHNVAAVIDYGVLAEGQPYLIMEYLDGKNLAEVIQEAGSLAPERITCLMIQACDGLSAAHTSNLVHRDIKPANMVLVTAEDGSERLKVLDFGLAKVTSPDGSAAEHLTQTGEVLGTPAYMSPEQCMGTPLDGRSDIYSLGCVMYTALTGKHALEAENSFDIMNKHLNVRPVSMAKIRPDLKIPPSLQKIVYKSLEKEPADRYQTVTELKNDLLGVPVPITTRIARAWRNFRAESITTKGRRAKKLRNLTIVLVLSLVVSDFATREFAAIKEKERQAAIADSQNKFAKFSGGGVSFEYPQILSLSSNLKDKEIICRLAHKKDDIIIELKHFTKDLTPLELANEQEKYHKVYDAFVPSQTIHPVKFGKDSALEGYQTTFACLARDLMTVETHTYFGAPKQLRKFKLRYFAKDRDRANQLYESFLKTVEYKP